MYDTETLEIEFENWLNNQRKSNGTPYAKSTILAYINRLKKGLDKVQDSQYKGINCFTITKQSEFQKIYDEVYPKAEIIDKREGNKDFRNGLEYYLKYLNERENNENKKMMVDRESIIKNTVIKEDNTIIPKNLILYGPPGTGKTYHSVVYAVAIVENRNPLEVMDEEYCDVVQRYEKYKKLGFIEFTTFHQSYGYEEFIEGIKPVMNTDDEEQGDIRYEIKAGIFKNFCENANILSTTESNITFDDAWNALITEAFNNNGNYKFTRRTGTQIDAILQGVDKFTVFWNSNKNSHNDLTKHAIYKQWTSDGTERSALSGGTRWLFDARQSVLDELINKFGLSPYESKTYETSKNYVFIIDEINRGNISKIFGELITLIEPTKRIGQTESIFVRLPYSQKLFGVPNNVYLIGTMNTADRSIATIDTALRRRFSFNEMLPNAKLLENVMVENVNIGDMLNVINKRISVLYDREHTIGHAYFMPLIANSTIEMLSDIFKNNIIPLLQEYFFEDYQKIRMVLGDTNKPNQEHQFIVEVHHDYEELFGNADFDLDERPEFEINYKAFNNIEAYRLL